MKLLREILRRPMSVLLVIIAVLLFGFSAIREIPMGYMPNMDMPMELVMLTWPGADADSVERLVTEEVEDACEALADVHAITSTTYDNYMTVQITYEYGTDLDDAYMELKAAMDNLKGDLPDGVGEPSIMEISMSAGATMSVSVSGAGNIQSLVENELVPALEAVSGVAKVDVTGVSEEYMRIVVDEAAMAQYGLSLSSIASAITAEDFDMPVGSVTIGTQEIALSAKGDIDVTSRNFPQIPIRTSSGQLVRLSDVITFVNLYRDEAESISRYNGETSILVEITKQKSAQSTPVCRGAQAVLDRFAGEDLSYRIISNEADDIAASLKEVVKTLAIGVALTMAVLFLFFGDLRASLIVGCSMPLSILMAVIILAKMGISFDLMSGTALIISIGMIVDNSIVVLESCFRAREREADIREAAFRGTKEVLVSIAAGTLTTVVVYVPLAMAKGITGQMAGPLSWTIGLAMLSSLICAVTVVPLLFTLVKPRAREELPINRLLAKLQRFYRRVIPGLLQHPGRVLMAGALILALSIGLLTQMEFVLFPSNYDGSMEMEVTFRSGTKLEVMDQRVRELEDALLSDDQFENVTLDISGNTASFNAYAVKNAARTSEEAVEEYLSRFGKTPGMDVRCQALYTSGGLGSMMTSGNTKGLTLVADDLGSLQTAAGMVEELMAQVPGVLHIDNPFHNSRVQGRVVIDAQKALAAGLTQSAAAGQIRFMLSGMTVMSVDYGDREYDVRLEYPEGKYDSVDALMSQPLTTSTGSMITLSDIASIEYGTNLPSISRQDGQFITTVTALTTADSRLQASKEIDAAFARLRLPAGVSQGQTATDQTSGDEVDQMGTTMAIAIFLVFMVMALQFNSPRLSLMVMLCIPFSLAGSFALLFLAGRILSLMGLMGFLVLFGIVVNNGIMLVDMTGELRKTMPLGEALTEAGVTRLRPILMTTLTTVISMIPAVFSQDNGMGMMREMSLIVIGGLLTSTVLTLFLMPSFYLLIRGERPDGSKRRGLLQH